MTAEILRSRAEFIKSDKERVSKMCNAVEEYVAMKAQETDKIYAWLAENGKAEELLKAFKDPVLKEKLMGEYMAAHGI